MADITVKVAEILGKNFKPTKEINRNDYNQSQLNKAETVLLMLYLRENGALLKDITNSQLADCFGKVTGYSGEQLRQAMSNASEDMKTENYEKLILLFKGILKKIEEDKNKL